MSAENGEEGSRGGLLLVEDNDADIIFFRRALTRTKAAVSLEVVTNGVSAVQYLSGGGPYSDRAVHPLPAMLLLDLKLPRMSGLEVLEWMKTQPSLHSIRTVVLTSSSEESDICRAYALGALSYLVKPVEFAALQEVVASIIACWSDPDAPVQDHLGPHAVPLPAPH